MSGYSLYTLAIKCRSSFTGRKKSIGRFCLFTEERCYEGQSSALPALLPRQWRENLCCACNVARHRSNLTQSLAAAQPTRKSEWSIIF